MDLKRYIRDIPDFPQPGILFRDITPLLNAPRAFQFTIERLTTLARAHGAEGIVAIESRGFIFGAPVAAQLSLPFVPIRKPGKLPAERNSVEYSLEYGSGELDIHKDALSAGQRVVIVDDLLATGGTAAAAAELVHLSGGVVGAVLFVVELSALGGRSKFPKHNVEALLTY